MFSANFQPLWCVAAAVLCDRSLADDVLQEAALIGLQKLDRFEAGTSFRAWMSQIVRNVARNTGRRRVRGPVSASEALASEVDERPRGCVDEALSISRGGEVRGEQEEFDDEVMDALDNLGETARACLLLRTVLDTPYQEIARLLDIPEGTAMSHVHRARREMRRRLEPASAEPPEERDLA
ncbi:MAG: RNA polymerase sigma factor [Planctomycetota bacterium]